MKKLLATLMLLASTTVMANPIVGVEYNTTTKDITTDNPSKIEVLELFWYGCIHCYQLEPQLHTWANKLPADVVFKRVPGLPRADWAPMAKAYYAMETLGVLDKLHGKLFDAIHKSRTLKPTDEAAAIAWVAKEGGLDKKKVQEAFNSFTSNTKLNRAAQIFRDSGATGVPALIIDGKYVTSSSMAGGNVQVLKVADHLIAKARAEKK
ncbi:MAG: thiol:disulfide interchange protein DsbA/DsbL [Methylophilaceae bacterium]|nr:thiol:disulfide interchange protein DsbA/DsbL [Methylophilaceae bacterium]